MVHTVVQVSTVAAEHSYTGALAYCVEHGCPITEAAMQIYNAFKAEEEEEKHAKCVMLGESSSFNN